MSKQFFRLDLSPVERQRLMEALEGAGHTSDPHRRSVDCEVCDVLDRLNRAKVRSRNSLSRGRDT